MHTPRWIGYSAAHQILEALHDLMERPTRPRMPNLLLVGEPNNGKTTIVRHFFELHGKGYVTEDAKPHKPIILAEAPPSADEKGLYVSILERFYAPHRPTDPVAKLRFQVIHLFRECNTRLLIIDEFHSLLTGSAIKQREIMNAIKFLCNELMIPTVGVGTREAVRVLHTDPQHASRFDVITLPTWCPNEAFQNLLADFEALLPLRKRSRLYERELASTLHSISGGNFGDLHRLLIECATAAIQSGAEQIDLNIIRSKAHLRPTRGIRTIPI